jgi:hypothetical protein
MLGSSPAGGSSREGTAVKVSPKEFPKSTHSGSAHSKSWYSRQAKMDSNGKDSPAGEIRVRVVPWVGG